MKDQPGIQSFIDQHRNKSLTDVALLLAKQKDLPKQHILNQINGWQKSKVKLPAYHQHAEIVFPSTLSMEQCSSEQTAQFKASQVKGNSLVDLTGGFGVDSYYFSQKFSEVSYIEPDQELFEVSTNNFKVLNANNIKAYNTTAEEFLLEADKHDVVYIDPSRRKDHQKVFRLSDCVPDIIAIQPEIEKIASEILIKTSPMLDIKQSLKDLSHVEEVIIVSVKNECKEVLYKTKVGFDKETSIRCVNLDTQQPEFKFSYQQEKATNVNYSDPLRYLYEANSSINKAGAFNAISERFELQKLAINSHLYTSNELIEDFPGRIFKIIGIAPYQLKAFKKFNLSNCNISIRNFPDKLPTLKKKLKLNEGGDDYLFATRDQTNKPVLINCRKI